MLQTLLCTLSTAVLSRVAQDAASRTSLSSWRTARVLVPAWLRGMLREIPEIPGSSSSFWGVVVTGQVCSSDS